MPYLRFSQFDEDINGNPISYTKKQSFNSHKTRRKREGALVIFSNINEQGKVISPHVPLNARVAIANNEPGAIPEVLPDIQNLNVNIAEDVDFGDYL